MHFFRVRMGDYYTLAVEGAIEEVEKELNQQFPEVKYLRTTEPDSPSAKRCTGHRTIGNIVIKGCYFSGHYARGHH